jgi:glutathione S-transferase
MTTPDVVLWHFPISHFNEKVRWALDLKGIAHRRKTLGPDYLVRAWWAVGRATLPVIFIDGRAIGDSTRIIEALEELRPTPALYPRDASERSRALMLEDWLDEEVGPAVRSAVVAHLFAGDDPGAAIDTLTLGMPSFANRMMRGVLPAFRWFYYSRHRVDGARVDGYCRTVLAALDRLERELGGRAYLVGDAFSVADLTAASLLCPIVGPDEMQYRPDVELPPALDAFQRTVVEHPIGRWTADMFRRHRGSSAELG